MEEKLRQMAKLLYDIEFDLTPIEVDGTVCVYKVFGDRKKAEFLANTKKIRDNCKQIEKLLFELLRETDENSEK